VKTERTLSSESLPGGDLLTWANGVTGLRTVAGLLLFSIAAARQSMTLNLAGLLVYWALDILDGWLARRLRQETRLGAQIDILADRLLVTVFYFNFVTTYPDLLPVVLLFLFEFMGLDHYLSNQFIRWPSLRSPNYFHEVDRTIWRLNWSLPAKALNSGLVTLLLVTTMSTWPALPVIATLILIKLYSCVRMHRLPVPVTTASTAGAGTLPRA
jgi:CDP-diacylglycerol--glycerol-3-phosphate 3-phosphatidyltransferase